MNSFFNGNVVSRIALTCIFAAIVTLSSVFSVRSQTTTFAQFLEQNGSQDFVFTNNTTNASFNTVSGGSPIFFFYQNITRLPVSLQGLQVAHLTLTTTTTQSATLSSDLTQPFNQVVTIAITRDTPAPAGTGSGSRTNLLTAVITTAISTTNISGGTNGNSATMSATTPQQNVTFTSDFIGFIATTQRNFGLSFSSVTPALNLGAGNFLQSFTAAGTGTFASNPPPVYAPPTAAALSIGGAVYNDEGAPLSNAVVSITESNGTTRTTRTGSFGNFEFTGIGAGQNVTINVSSKKYQFDSQLFVLTDNISGLAFFPNQ